MKYLIYLFILFVLKRFKIFHVLTVNTKLQENIAKIINKYFFKVLNFLLIILNLSKLYFEYIKQHLFKYTIVLLRINTLQII
jgi:hypothetical protein